MRFPRKPNARRRLVIRHVHFQPAMRIGPDPSRNSPCHCNLFRIVNRRIAVMRKHRSCNQKKTETDEENAPDPLAHAKPPYRPEWNPPILLSLAPELPLGILR